MPPSRRGRRLRLDLRPAVRLDLWAATLALGVVLGTVAPALVPAALAACAVVSAGAFVWRGLVPEGWRLMAVLGPLFLVGGVGIALAHAGAPDPLRELAGLEPGGVVIVGRVSSPPVESGYGYRADVRVEHLWHEGREVLRGGGVEVFAGDLSVGVGDTVRVDGEISLPEVGEDGFDYARYIGSQPSLRGTPECIRQMLSAGQLGGIGRSTICAPWNIHRSSGEAHRDWH